MVKLGTTVLQQTNQISSTKTELQLRAKAFFFLSMFSKLPSIARSPGSSWAVYGLYAHVAEKPTRFIRTPCMIVTQFHGFAIIQPVPSAIASSPLQCIVCLSYWRGIGDTVAIANQWSLVEEAHFFPAWTRWFLVKCQRDEPIAGAKRMKTVDLQNSMNYGT